MKLLDRLADACRTQWKLQSISSQRGQEYRLQYQTPQGSKTIRTRSVALTVPAYVAAELLKQVPPFVPPIIQSITLFQQNARNA